MAKMSVQELHNEIAHALGNLSDLFVPGMKLSFMARLPGNGEADVLVGDDHDAAEMIALIHRRLGAPSPASTAGDKDSLTTESTIKESLQVAAPTAGQSIDTEAFRIVLDNWISALFSSDHRTRTVYAKQAYNALIAHIDTWAARSAGYVVPAGWVVSRFGSAFQRDAVRVIAPSGDAVTLRKQAPEPWEQVLYSYFDLVGAAPAPGNTEKPQDGKEE